MVSKSLIILGGIIVLAWLMVAKPPLLPPLRWEERWGEVPRTKEFYE